MASSEDEQQQNASTTRIKHTVLVQWALQPPQLQLLRPIDILITTIHQAFPSPSLGVPSHDYFAKWRPIDPNSFMTNGIPNEDRLKKAVRKVRFFLHPDKLPQDLTEDQRFTCKLLWDVTNDAYEDYTKGKDDLDWIS
jgi:hypothetical protein